MLESTSRPGPTTQRNSPAALPSFAQDALRHEAQAAYEAKRYALLQKQRGEAAAQPAAQDAGEGAAAQQAAEVAEEHAAAGSATLAQQEGLVRSMRTVARGAATDLVQLQVVGAGRGMVGQALLLRVGGQAIRVVWVCTPALVTSSSTASMHALACAGTDGRRDAAPGGGAGGAGTPGA